MYNAGKGGRTEGDLKYQLGQGVLAKIFLAVKSQHRIENISINQLIKQWNTFSESINYIFP